jgi:uncharacterized protein YggU (UPF0235/DUF167 family)
MKAAKAAAGRLRFFVKLSPKAGRNAIDGWAADAAGKPILKARVAAPPADGAANAALVALIAEALKIRRSDVRVVSGASSRTKLVEAEAEPALISRLAPAAKPQ